jgi:hypothetical protein
MVDQLTMSGLCRRKDRKDWGQVLFFDISVFLFVLQVFNLRAVSQFFSWTY